MTPDQLTEQTIAAFAAWKKDPKTPLHYSWSGHNWAEVDHPPKWEASRYYRIAPFILTNSINGHTLADGQDWHRSDGWKREWLTGNSRPVLKGEELKEGDPFRYQSGMADIVDGIAGETPEQNESCYFTTTRPLPSVIAPGHNPAALTVSQVGEGWRLLDEDEIHVNREAPYDKYGIEMWLETDNEWDNPGRGAFPDYTYRTRLSRTELAALDAPKMRAWDRASDVPMPICWVRNSESLKWLVLCVCKSGIHYTGSSIHMLNWEEMKGFEYSTDGKTFHPCTVPA